MNFYIKIKNYSAYVLNGTGEKEEPVHIHIKKGNEPNDQAKFWISFDKQRVIIEHNKGKIPTKVWQEIVLGIINYDMNDLLCFWARLKEVDIVELDFYDQHGHIETKQYYPSL